MAVMRKRDSFPVTYKEKLTSSSEKVKKYLSEYLQFNPEDHYWEGVHRQLIMGKDLNAIETERAEELMKSYDLDEAHIDSLLGGAEETKVTVDPNRKTIGNLIEAVEKADGSSKTNTGRLNGWDKEFIYGKDKGWSLLTQYNRRKSISAKQEVQLKRIATILGIKTTEYP